jgi:hypothetical protein
VTDGSKLERRYRRSLVWYPPQFRQENSEEIVAVLMACSRDGQRRPGLAASADLIRSGLSMRLRPSARSSAPTVRAAVRLMYTGAAVTTLSLVIGIISLAYVGQGAATLRVAGRNQPFPVAIAVGIVVGLAEIALWLWMARANSEGRNWARVISTVLFGLATLRLSGNKDALQVVFALVTWLVAMPAVWLLWRPASSEVFKRQSVTQAG